jgi:hypothetical protein
MYEAELAIAVIAATIVGGLVWFRTKNACMKLLKDAEALSPEKAVKPEEAGISGWNEATLQNLPLFGFVKKTDDGRYYVECKDGKHC